MIKEIKRDKYLNKLISHKQNGLIKIISGIRRCGKSYLLFELFKNHLLQEKVESNHIIQIALDDFANKKYRNPNKCYNYVKSCIKDDNIYYLLLDEVQLMDEFEDVLNGFLHIKNLDIFVTGSNSKFLSSDVVTKFRGRGDEIRIYPLNFAEYFSILNGNFNEAWKEYYTYGGMPLVLGLKSFEEKSSYLQNLFKETYLKDIIERNGVKNTDEFEEIINLLASNIGGLINVQKISNTFNSVKHINISAPTIKQYLDYLQESFIVSKAVRYDVKGKKYINTPSKYYFTDIGLRNAILNFRQQEESHIMENIIYNELLARDYSVDVGQVNVLDKTDKDRYKPVSLEVDFVANKGSKKYYIQSALEIANAKKENQEKKSLLKINDSFKKIIIVREDIMPKQDDTGIITIGLKDFLLNGDIFERI